MSNKCSGPHDTDVEPFNEQELIRFSQLIGTKKACQLFANKLSSINPSVDSEQKFRNIAGLTQIFLNKVHQLEDVNLGLQAIDLGN